jgi:signal transduction histidine kinase
LQEALTNVARHAHAKNVWVELRRDQEDVCLIVEDDGVGLENHAGNDGRGLGLLGLQERLGLLGGRLEVETAAGQGTRLVLRLPVPDEIRFEERKL